MLFTKRKIQDKIIKNWKNKSLLRITGPFHSGKTTLAKTIMDEGIDASYLTIDDTLELNRKFNHPESHDVKNLILDEVEQVREYRKRISYLSDRFRILSLLSSSSADHSIEILPMTIGEYNNKPERFIEKIFSEELKISKSEDTIDIFDYLLKGSFSEVHRLWDDTMIIQWFNTYLNSVLNHAGIISKVDRTILLNLLTVLSRYTSSTLNTSAISRDADIPNTSLKRYLKLLERLYIIYRLEPIDIISCVKSKKMLFIDNGLLNHFLDIRTKEMITGSILYRNIFRNFITMEIIKQVTWLDPKPELYFYSTTRGLEADIIIKNEQKYVCFAINPGFVIRPNELKTLQILHEELGRKFHAGIILYNGKNPEKLADKIYALPVEWMVNS